MHLNIDGWSDNMPITINGNTFHQTAEVCKIAGISKNTLLRWIRDKKFADVEYWDRRGWRLFRQDDLNRLKEEVNKVHTLSDRQKWWAARS